MMDFYYMDISAPCRAAMLTAKALGVNLNKKVINLLAGDQMKPEYVAINPEHCVPTLVDGKLTLWESKAICTYLVSQYGNDSLYPKDPTQRAKVDRLLYFDMGTLYHRFSEYVYPVGFGGQKTSDPAKLQETHEALGWLDSYLAGHDFAVGNNITVADHCLVSSIATFHETGIDLTKYSHITVWFNRCKKQMPGYNTENAEGAAKFGALMKSKGKF